VIRSRVLPHCWREFGDCSPSRWAHFMDPQDTTESLLLPEQGAQVPTLFRILAVCLGTAVALYAGGALLLLPLGGAFAAGFIYKKAIPSRRSFIPTAAVVTGHIVWMTIGGLLSGNAGASVADVAVLSILTVWLLARPGLPAVMVMSCAAALPVVSCAGQLSSGEWGTSTHKALVLHLSLHACTLFFVVIGYFDHRGETKNAMKIPN